MLLERLALESGLRADRLRYFARTASQRYYVFSVPKATGGTREIAHPARPLKAVQRWLNANYFNRLPVHECATAYRKGISIRDNAARHLGTRYTVRIDFRSFFPNFTNLHVYQYLKTYQDILEMTDDDAMFVTRLVCRYDGLTIGAPTSPFLTNAMMYEFDRHLQAYCQQMGLIFTRYADDVFISASLPNMLNGALEKVKEIAFLYPFANLKINGRKTAFLSKRYHREITGLVLTSDDRISLGRARKREIKALVHRFLLGELSGDRLDYFKGLMSFASDAEPAFIASLHRKYGDDLGFALHMKAKRVATSFSALERLDPPGEAS